PPKWTGYQLLALIFGTLLSSQGTDASFVLTLSGFPPGFRSAVLRFRLYQTLSCPISSALSRFSLSRFPFRRFRLYQNLSGLTPSQRVVLLGLLGPCGE
ncbi:hypothetical protein, partial [Streptomyces yangpuensis]|uniref:hypothetical protein n=1 Tax=Streptomyces yangpuensis TaxID=1648182 RepID=UPI0036AA2E5F